MESDREAVVDRRFSFVRDGYDPTEVDRYLGALAGDLARSRVDNHRLAARLAHAEAEIERLRAARQRIVESHAVMGRALDAAVGEPPGASPPPVPVPVTAHGGPARSDADELALQRRDAELDGLVAGMARALKRALQDEHNDLLDRLRQVRGTPTAAVLGTTAAQAGRYAGAARPFVERAAAAGARFAPHGAGGPAASRIRTDVAADRHVTAVVGPAVAGAVAALVDPLRQRVEEVLDERGRDGTDVIVDALASVYRETRSQRIESLTTVVRSAAHAEATWRAAPDGGGLRWVTEDADGPCPDCDDNALAGLVVKGEPFPTGQLHPPAHHGCRCLLVPPRP